MCKHSIDDVLHNFGISIPVHSIYQTEMKFKCYYVNREFNQLYIYVKLFDCELPKSLRTIDNLRNLLELGIFMLAIKKQAVNTMKKIMEAKKTTEIIPPRTEDSKNIEDNSIY